MNRNRDKVIVYLKNGRVLKFRTSDFIMITRPVTTKSIIQRTEPLFVNPKQLQVAYFPLIRYIKYTIFNLKTHYFISVPCSKIELR